MEKELKIEDEMKKLDEYIDGLETKEGKLIIVLHYAQELIGYLPEDLQLHIAEKMKIPPAKVFGVVTFYSFFNQNPKGENKISVCLGTACFVRGSQDIYNEFRNKLKIGEGEVTKDGLFSLDGIRCVGACGLAPVVSVNGKVYGRVTKEDVEKILQEYS
ncbi:nadh-quinone oxidoreductase e subunit [Holotrichia oblita]|nr:nadh-quinone oxidoreductase e subunit [Holotrichia oblita]